MTNATHFIEVWGTNYFATNGPLLPITALDESLYNTDQCATLKTIAVWKIRLKD